MQLNQCGQQGRVVGLSNCNKFVSTSRSVVRAFASRKQNIQEIMKQTVAGVLASTLLVSGVAPAMAAELSVGDTQPVYFGNGCFWGRQKDFVDVEKEMGRDGKSITAISGYAGGAAKSLDDKACYYYALDDSVYDKLGHAEAVEVNLTGDDTDKQEQMRMFAKKYFSDFNKTPFGVLRLDPQDAGSGYRNVIGIPGGINSPYMEIIKQENINNMKLVESTGDKKEEDKIGVIYIKDSGSFPFYAAEQYHQFHDGIGKPFPKEYKNLKAELKASGRVKDTGCPEFGFF